jgi:hypothetical protein
MKLSNKQLAVLRRYSREWIDYGFSSSLERTRMALIIKALAEIVGLTVDLEFMGFHSSSCVSFYNRTGGLVLSVETPRFLAE